MRRAALPLLAAALALSGCGGGGGAPAPTASDYYDHQFRYAIYDHNAYWATGRPDRPEGRPDRPRPPPGVAPGRPVTLPVRAPHRHGGRRGKGGRR